MADYGHDLLFGSFITPTNSSPDQVVALARASEEAGLDLVTFQDHPYQPRFLDTWTLLPYLAARTERIRLAPNVANLPLRLPAVLARAAATLDLLSGGRFELGLGAGGFGDAVEAMGGPRRSPGQAVDALGEAIDVIRGIWDADNPARLQVHGEHYRVDGAKRGPAPAHDIDVWIGAYGPRMLRMTGRKADGWLPSMPFLESADALTEGNAVIDAAAAEAGREPAAVRRLLNLGERLSEHGPDVASSPSWWAEQLTALALDHGVSAFILMTDDLTTVARFGEEVAAAVREAVARQRRP